MGIESKINELGACTGIEMTVAHNNVVSQFEEAKTDAMRVRQNSTAYAVGDKVIVPGKSSYDLMLKCTTAGTSGSTAITYTGLEVDDTITDGTVVWTCINRVDTEDPALVTNIANLLTDNDTFNTAISNAVIQSQASNPAGAIIAFSGAGTVPIGYLLCDGSAINRTTYAGLFTAIGTTYGAGDESTTFNIPDFRGKFLRGYKSGVTQETGIEQGESLPNIKGAMQGYLQSGTGAVAISTAWSSGPTTQSQAPYGSNFNFDASRNSTIYGSHGVHKLTIKTALTEAENLIIESYEYIRSSTETSTALQATAIMNLMADNPYWDITVSSNILTFTPKSGIGPKGLPSISGSATAKAVWAWVSAPDEDHVVPENYAVQYIIKY